ncbi:MAG: hypothetical protein DSM106950_06805 [Stigonema ocellatum SAG 48.90 = DSM 106950]|nr:hypothetical protein [Stigonema ocellatum SAG 48.90 = DSM 106950]
MDKIDNNHIDSQKISIASDFMQRLWDGRVIITLALLAIIFRFGYYNTSQMAIPSTMVTASEVTYKTKKEVIGKTVTIRSKPIQKVGLSSFMVSDQQFLGGEPTVVINASGVPFDLPTDQNIKVQVTGQVRNLVIPEIERDFKLQLLDESYRDYVNKPVIIAQSIALAPKLSEITNDPSKYYGKRLAVMGRVQNIQSPVLFTMDENQLIGTKELVVLLKATPKAAINQGQTVTMVGVVRPFVVADIEREYNITWNQRVREEMEAQYGNKPVLIADVIYP